MAIAVIACATVLLAIALMGNQTGLLALQKQHAETIKIGAILPFTGTEASWGADAREGIELAAEEINSAGSIEGKKIEIIFEDGQCKPAPAATAAQKLISVDNVHVIIGEICSSATLAIAPIAENSRTVLISPGSASPKITQAGDYIFRNWISDAFTGKKMAQLSYKDLAFKELAVLYINNEWGTGLKDSFEIEFKKLGGKILASEAVEQDAKDFRTQLAKIKAKKPKAIFMPVYYIEAALILKQAKELGIDAQFLSGDSVEKPELIETAGELAEGIIFAAPFYDAESKEEKIRNFVNKYESRYGRKPGVVAAHAYDAMNIIVLALQQCKTAYGPCIKEALYKMKDFPGITGTTSFDSNGDATKTIILKTVRNGKFVPFEE